MASLVVSGSMHEWKALLSSPNSCFQHHHYQNPAATHLFSPSAHCDINSFYTLRPSMFSTRICLTAAEAKRRFRYEVRAKQNDKEPSIKLRDQNRIEQALPDFAELKKNELQSFLHLELESSFDFEQSRHYEMVFLIHEACAEQVPSVIKDVTDFISEKKGKIWRLNDWGMRNLAYKIKKARRANYILMNIEMSSQAINGLKALLDKDERVIRHLVMKEKKAITEPTEPPEEYFPMQASEDDQSSSLDDYATDEEGEDEELEEEEEEEEDEEEEVEDVRDELVLR